VAAGDARAADSALEAAVRISHTDRFGVWVFIERDDALHPWFRRTLDLVEGGLLGVCVGVMWVPRRRRKVSR
jgi:hypothetical protein